MAWMRIRVWNGAAEAATASVENTAAKCILIGFCFLDAVLGGMSWEKRCKWPVVDAELMAGIPIDQSSTGRRSDPNYIRPGAAPTYVDSAPTRPLKHIRSSFWLTRLTFHPRRCPAPPAQTPHPPCTVAVGAGTPAKGRWDATRPMNRYGANLDATLAVLLPEGWLLQ